jgi:hypothetical protein
MVQNPRNPGISGPRNGPKYGPNMRFVGTPHKTCILGHFRVFRDIPTRYGKKGLSHGKCDIPNGDIGTISPMETLFTTSHPDFPEIPGFPGNP